jgi:hypothetical protein
MAQSAWIILTGGQAKQAGQILIYLANSGVYYGKA